MAKKKNIGATISLKDGGFKSGIKGAISQLGSFKKGSDSASSSVKRFGSQANSAGASLTSMAKKITGVVATYASLKQIVSFGKECIDAFGTSEAAVKRLETTMMNVKGTTMEQVNAIKAYTSELQNTTVVEDDVTKQGASQLATFQLQSSTIKTLLPSLQDLAVAQYGVSVSGDQMQQMSNLLGKVMTGNVGALSRYGVTMTAAQQKILKTGSESKKAAMLVEVLGKNFGGLATSMADTPEGRVQQFKNVWGDMYEVIGKELYPIVTSFLTYVTQRLPSITNAFTSAASIVIGGFQKIEPIITGVIDVIWEGFEVYVVPAVKRFGSAISPVTSGLAEMGGSVDWLDVISAGFDYLSQGVDLVSIATSGVINNWNVLSPIVYGVAGAIGAYKLAVIGCTAVEKVSLAITKAKQAFMLAEGPIMAAYTAAHWALSAGYGPVTAAQWAFNAAVSANPIGMIIVGIGALIAIGVALWKNWDSVSAFFVNCWGTIKTAFSVGINWIKDNIQSVVLFIINPFAGVFHYLYNNFEGFRNFIDGMVVSVKNTFVKMGTSIANGVSSVFKRVINGVIGFAGNLINNFINSINFAIDIINKIPGVGISKLQTVNLPMLANGGNIRRPGDVIVGERGPEMLHLPRGASVEPLDRKGGKTENKFYINIDARDKSPEEIANELVPKLKLALEVL